MTLTVKHPFTCLIGDDPSSVAAGEVVPSKWNANHTLTGATNQRLLFGASDGTVTDSASLLFSGTSLIVGGAPSGATTTDKLQVNGDALFGNIRVNYAGVFDQIDSVAGMFFNSGSGGLIFTTVIPPVSSPDTNGGDYQAIAGPGRGNANGGNALIASGEAGTSSGDSGKVRLYIGAPTSGSGGDGTFEGADGVGALNNGSNYTIKLGNKAAGGIDGVLSVTDNLGSGTFRYLPRTDTLTVGNLQFGTYQAGVVVQAGYITVTDSGGTTRRLLVG